MTMKLTVRAKPGARSTDVEALQDGSYKVSVTAVADKGKANQAVIAALADHFNVSKGAIHILTGHTTRRKLVKIA